MNSLNIKAIKEEDLPLIVLSNSSKSFFNWATSAKTGGNYNHIMIMHKIGKVASQDLSGYKTKSIKKYLVPNMRMKFWKIKDLSEQDKIILFDVIDVELALPWYKRRYDFLGILGQLFSFNKFNNPWTKYCSERVAGTLKKIERFSCSFPDHPSPSYMNKRFKDMKSMEVFGRWFFD